jgi:SHS family lactate transporter-like MFS transporter
MTAVPTTTNAGPAPRFWYAELTRDQRNAFWASYLGWMLDGFDYSIISFLLVDIQRSFTVSSALAGALATVALMFRVVGGISAGTAADRWGRKGPLMFSILWYSSFAFLSAFSTSYAMLFVCRALFGIGMGGVWSAGMPLAIEHCPIHRRGLVSGLLQGGYALGVILAAAVYQFVYPLVSDQPEGWRMLLWLGILPAGLVVWIMRAVKESPVWLERQRQGGRQAAGHVSFADLFRRDLLPITIHTSLFLMSLLFLYNSISWWYPTLLDQLDRPRLPFLVAFHSGGIVGGFLGGHLSETRLGRRGSAALVATIGVAVTPLYLFSDHGALLALGAALMGIFGTGAFGIVPTYLSERFPTAARAAGAGFAYQAGAAMAAIGPTLIGSMRDNGIALASAMAICIVASGTVAIALAWLGPETRGWKLES